MAENRLILLEELLENKGNTYFCANNFSLNNERVDLVFYKTEVPKESFSSLQDKLNENKISLLYEFLTSEIKPKVYQDLIRICLSGINPEYFLIRDDESNLSIIKSFYSENKINFQPVEKYLTTTPLLELLDVESNKRIKKEIKKIYAAKR